MLRRHVVSHDDWARPQYGTPTMMSSSPRKWTTFLSPPSYNTYRYQVGDRFDNYPNQTPIGRQWMIGKKFIPWNGVDVSDYMRVVEALKLTGQYASSPFANYVHEYELTLALRGNIFRIMFVRDGILVSKPSAEYRPGETNVFIDATSNIILGVFAG